MERQTVLKSELDHLLQQETVELVQLKRYFDIKLSGSEFHLHLRNKTKSNPVCN